MTLNYRRAGLLYLVFIIVYTTPYWLQGDVISPHRQSHELGATENDVSDRLENRRFNDYTNSYAPEIYIHQNESRSGQLLLWTNLNELGRPVSHLSLFSPSYIFTWLISSIVKTPEKIITYLSLSFCFISGLFILLLCKEWNLAPMAALIGAISIATLPPFMYWLTFPMVAATYAWTSGVIYAVTRLARRLDMSGWVILVFCVFSLLITARKQSIVYQSYIVVGYVFYILYQQIRAKDIRLTLRYMATLGSAVVLGGLLALPMILDLMHNAAVSARLSTGVAFFTSVLPDFDSASDVVRFLVLGAYPWVFGNPVTTDYPVPYSGLSATPCIVLFSLICLMLRWRDTWGWWIAIAFYTILTCVPLFFEFAVQYLGFNLSRSFPLGHMVVPLIIVTAYGADTVIKIQQPKQYSREIAWAVAALIFLLLLSVSYGGLSGIAIDWTFVLLSSLTITLLATQILRTKIVFLIAVLIIQAATLSYPLMLRQKPEHIVTTSPLVEKIHKYLAKDSYFAIVTPGLSVLPPNLNARVGLPSIHSYNSLSSVYYHELIEQLGGNVKRYGRVNHSISPDFDGVTFWMSNIGVILSRSSLSHDNIEFIEKVHGVNLYKVLNRMGESMQVFSSYTQHENESSNINIAAPRTSPIHHPTKIMDQGDFLDYDVKKGRASTLVLSQKYHTDWQAEAYVYDQWIPTNTNIINGIFQGVSVPKGTERVRLAFKPYSRHAWLLNYFWLSLLIIVLYKGVRKNS